MTLNWTKANDNMTAQNALKYYVYRSTTSFIMVDGLPTNGGTPLNGTGGSTDISSYNATALTGGTNYYFIVVVEDLALNKAAYTYVMATPLVIPAEQSNIMMIIAIALIGILAAGGAAAGLLLGKKKKEKLSEKYAVISYSHANTDVVNADLKAYEENDVCYWYDGQMTVGRGFDTQFNEKLDDKNCKGIIFFVSDQFLLSDPCGKEMKYFKEKYGIDNPDKFCLFVLPSGYPYDNADKIYDKVERFVHEKNDEETRKKLRHLSGHIELYLDLLRNGKEKFVTLGDAEAYVKDCCEEGKLFHKAGIIRT